MRNIIKTVFFIVVFVNTTHAQMMFGDTTRTGSAMAKDPHVVHFKGRYLMYYSIPASTKPELAGKGWGIAIAESQDLTNWKRIGEIDVEEIYEQKGFCAPGALVIDGKIHLFYQTYGNWEKDAICHAWSEDGLHFVRNPKNPIFRPSGGWTCGRAIDAEVVKIKDRYLLYFATRDTTFKTQKIGVASSEPGKSLSTTKWEQVVDSAILSPKLAWEKNCIEGASVIQKNSKWYMFYAGAYNNQPQQVGVAVSNDGVHWKRLYKEPLLSNGKPGEWNSSESGHPHIFKDINSKTYLFFQGNNDHGKTWYLSQKEVKWTIKGPKIK